MVIFTVLLYTRHACLKSYDLTEVSPHPSAQASEAKVGTPPFTTFAEASWNMARNEACPAAIDG